jgi:hypothetical protein
MCYEVKSVHHKFNSTINSLNVLLIIERKMYSDC